MIWVYERQERQDPQPDTDIVVPDAPVEEEEVTFLKPTKDDSRPEKETRLEERYQTDSETRWDINEEALKDELRQSTDWYPYLSGASEDILLGCDLAEVEVELAENANGGKNATELAIQDPTVLDREARDYPWVDD